jgi:hypothetical protein
MNRNEKLRKLGNAIREYRGRWNSVTGKWINPPKPEKEERIFHWLTQLNVPEPIPAMADIQEFKTFEEMRAWMNTLSTE